MDAPEKPEGSKGPKLEWMYKPSALVDREEYLTGRSVDKSLKLLDEIEKGNNPSEFNYLQEAEKDLTPLSIFQSQGSSPADLIKKIKDDPLYQIQKKEQENLKKLLQNPVKMKQYTELIEARDAAGSSSKSKHKKSKDKKHKHKKHKNHSDDSDDEYKDSKRHQRRHKSSSSSSDDRGDRHRDREKRHVGTDRDRDNKRDRFTDSRPNRSSERKNNSGSDFVRSSDEDDHEKRRKEIIERFKRKAEERKKIDNFKSRREEQTNSRSQRKPLGEDELEKKRQEMMENAKWREQQRTKNVTKYREEQKKEDELAQNPQDNSFIRKQLLEAANSGSVEQRVKSNSYNIQRSQASMNQNFLKRS